MNGMSGIWDVGNILFYPQAGSRVCTGTESPPCLRFYFHASEGVIREACAARCAMCQWVLVFVNHLDLMIVYNARLWLIPILLSCGKESGTLTDQMVSANLNFLELPSTYRHWTWLDLQLKFQSPSNTTLYITFYLSHCGTVFTQL